MAELPKVVFSTEVDLKAASIFAQICIQNCQFEYKYELKFNDLN